MCRSLVWLYIPTKRSSLCSPRWGVKYLAQQQGFLTWPACHSCKPPVCLPIQAHSSSLSFLRWRVPVTGLIASLVAGTSPCLPAESVGLPSPPLSMHTFHLSASGRGRSSPWVAEKLSTSTSTGLPATSADILSASLHQQTFLLSAPQGGGSSQWPSCKPGRRYFTWPVCPDQRTPL